MAKISKKLIQELKFKLKEEKRSLEDELEKFAKQSKEHKGDWKTNFPLFDGEVGGAALESGADEIEEYSTLLPMERNLENRLKDINLALKKMKIGKYGICEKCGNLIDIERLKVYPEARQCSRCKK